MVKFVLVLLSTLITIEAVAARSVPSGNGLTYIGSFRSSSQNENTQSFNHNNYFMSQNPTAWNIASNDCRNVLGANATLLAIESEEEWTFLRELLDNFGAATEYWAGGIYDAPASKWRWNPSGIELPPFAPWGAGYPGTPNPSSRLQIHYGGIFDATWLHASYTILNRFICEVQVPTISQPCYQQNDLAILLDSSGSVGAEDFQIALQFVERLAHAFTVYNGSRLSFITFSTVATTHINISNTLSRAEISSTILSTPYISGSTYTNLAIDEGVAQLTYDERGVPMNMVVLTDGASTDKNATLESARAAITAEIATFSVGITQQINHEELLYIAGNHTSRVFISDNFDELINLLAPLSMIVCPT